MFSKKNVTGAATATSVVKGLMREEKLGLLSMPPRKTRNSMRKLQARDFGTRIS